MELIHNIGSILFKFALVNIVLMILSQFVVPPIIAGMIYRRCAELGYKMRSRPELAGLKGSSFWAEASEFDKKYSYDDTISLKLKLRDYYEIYKIISIPFLLLTLLLYNPF